MRGLSDKCVLVTGATGFIGANLVRGLLEAGCRNVNIFTRPASDKWRLKDVYNRLREFRADIRRSSEVSKAVNMIKPQVIFHCAVYGGFAKENDEKRILETNLNGTMNLIKALSPGKYESLVTLGSSSEYGIKSGPMKEADTLSPVGFYGFAKASATIFSQLSALAYKKPVTTVRPFSVYGPYEYAARLVPAVVRACLKEESLNINSPDSVRDFVYVQDAVDLLIKTALKKKSLGVLNLGCGRQYSVKELVETALEVSGSKVQVIWGKGNIKKLEPDPWFADMRRVKQSLNWSPKTNLKQGLRKTFDWMRDNLQYYA